MVLDRIENSKFILQNTLIEHGTKVKIPQDRPFYADYDMMTDCYDCYNDYVYYGDKGEFMTLANEQIKNMKKETWYLLPQAYSIILRKK